MHASTQMLVVTTANWDAVTGTLRRYERANTRKKWKAVGVPIPVVVAKKGMGWGAGVAPLTDFGVRGAVDPARYEAGPVKHEGDTKAPAGLFRLSTAFGYAPQRPAGWKMPYVSLTPTVECVDDPHSKYYNRVVDRATVSPDWNSSEHMLYSNGQYRWGLVVDDNTDPVVPGAGSCIFMHIWLGTGEGTVGCTAMAQGNLEALLAWLDPSRDPLLLQLPLEQYKKLRRRWKLPALPRSGQR
jgi:L,D-peptidoglycan transpeptidase YkuD (ErfK/YbiS/YcfS/YnhG family)